MPTRKPADAIALLKADHRHVEDLFDKAEKAHGERKLELVRQICAELSVHTMIEEEIFYPACKGKIEDEHVLDEAYVEHDGAKVLIAELLASEPDAAFFDAKVKVLSEMIKHHVKEEEKRADGLLAQAKKAGLDVDQLGEMLMARKKTLMTALEEGRELPAPHTRSYTGHKLIQDAPVAQAA
ncbi:MAG TPA: hemerythrin domain-containing protein [Vineibacter sp.]|nr:hemerythrin domain-containing protein [Vineibacter sp.]